MIPVKCIRCGRKDRITIPADPSTEVPCLDCGSRMAVDIDAYKEEK